MALFKPYYVTSSKLNSLPKVAGQFILTTDTKRLYYDVSSSSRIQLYQDVTDTSSLENNIMSLKLSADKDLSITEAWGVGTIVPFDTIGNSIGGKLTLSNYGIKIGSGVSKIKVSANALVKGPTTTLMTAILLNNEAQSIAYYGGAGANYWGTTTHATVILDVTQNDIINLSVTCDKTGTVSVGGDIYSNLTVEVIS